MSVSSESHEHKGSYRSYIDDYHKGKRSLTEKDEHARYSKSKERHNELYSKTEKEYLRSSSHDSNKQKYDRYGESYEKDRHRSKTREHQLFGDDDDIPIQRSMKDLSVRGHMENKTSRGSLLDLPMPPGQEKHSSDLDKNPVKPKDTSFSSKPVSSCPSFLKGEAVDKDKVFCGKVNSLKHSTNHPHESLDQDKISKHSSSLCTKESNVTCGKSNKLNIYSTNIANMSSSGLGRTSKSVAQCTKPTDIPLPTYPNRPSIRENLGKLESPENEASFSPSDNNNLESLKSSTFELKINKSSGQLPAPQVNVEAIQKALNFINAHDKSKKPELGQGVSYRYEDFIGPASTSSASYDPTDMWAGKSFSKDNISMPPAGIGNMDIDLRTKVDIDFRQIPTGQFLKGSTNSMSSVSSTIISKPFNIVDHQPSFASPRSNVGKIEPITQVHQYCPNYAFKDAHSKNKDVDMRSLKPMSASQSPSVTNLVSSSTSPEIANVRMLDAEASESVRSRLLHDSDRIIKLGHKGVAASQLDLYKQKRERLSVNHGNTSENRQISSSSIQSGSYHYYKGDKANEVSILDELLPPAVSGKKESYNALISKAEIALGTGTINEMVQMKGSSLNSLSNTNEFEVTSSSSIDTNKQFRSLDKRNVNNQLNFRKVLDKEVRGNIVLKYDSSSCGPSGVRDPRTLGKNYASYDQRFGDKFSLLYKDSKLNTSHGEAQNSNLPQRRDPRLTTVEAPTDPRIKNSVRDPRNAPPLSMHKLHLESRALSSVNPHTPLPYNPVFDNSKYSINYNYSSDRPHFLVAPKTNSQPGFGNTAVPAISCFTPQRPNQFYQSNSQSSCSAIKDTFTCLIMRGLPHFTNSSHIYQFFEDYILRDLCIELDEAYHCKGTAYIHFPSHLSAKKALEVENGKSLNNFEISLGICSVGFLNQAKKVYDLQNIDREKYLNIPRRPRGNGNPYYKPKPRESPPRLVIPPVESSLPVTLSSEGKLLKDRESDSPGYSQLCATKLDGESSKVLQSFKIPKLKKTESQIDKAPLKYDASDLGSQQDDNEKVEFPTSAIRAKITVSDTDSDEHPIHRNKKNRRRRIRIGSDSDSDSCELENKESLNKKSHFDNPEQRLVISKSQSESNDEDLAIDDLPSNESDLSDSDSKDTSTVVENKKIIYGLSTKAEKIKGNLKFNKSVKKIKIKSSASSKKPKKKIMNKLLSLSEKKKTSKVLKTSSPSDLQDLGSTKLTRQKHEVFKDIFPDIKKYKVIIPIPRKYVYTLVDEVKHITGKRQKKSELLSKNSFPSSHVDILDSSVEVLTIEDELVDHSMESEGLSVSVTDQQTDAEFKEISKPVEIHGKLSSNSNVNDLGNQNSHLLVKKIPSNEKISYDTINLSNSKAIATLVTEEQPTILSNQEEVSNQIQDCVIPNSPLCKTKDLISHIMDIEEKDRTVATSNINKNESECISLISIKKQEYNIIENVDFNKKEKNTNDQPGKVDRLSAFHILDSDSNKKFDSLRIMEMQDQIHSLSDTKCNSVMKKRKIGDIANERQGNKKHRRISRKWHKGYKTSNILNSLNNKENFNDKISSSSSSEHNSKTSEEVVEEGDNQIEDHCRTSAKNNFVQPTSLFEVDLEDTELTDLTNINPSIENEMDIFETFPSSSSLDDAFVSASAIIKKYDGKESNDEEKKRIKLISEELVETANKFTAEEFKSQAIKLSINIENKSNSLTHEEDEEFSISDEVNQLVESLDQSFSDGGSTSVNLHSDSDKVQTDNNISCTLSDDNALKTFIAESLDVSINANNSLEISENSLHTEADSLESSILTDSNGDSKAILKDSCPSSEPLIDSVNIFLIEPNISSTKHLHTESDLVKAVLTEGNVNSNIVLNDSSAESISESDNFLNLAKSFNIDSDCEHLAFKIGDAMPEETNTKNNSLLLGYDTEYLQEKDTDMDSTNTMESSQTVETCPSTLEPHFTNEIENCTSEADGPSEGHDSDNDDLASVGIGSLCSIHDDNSLISGEERERDICTPDSSGSVVNKKLRKEKVSHPVGFGLIERRRITRGTLVVPQTETILWDDGGCVDLFQCDQCDYVGKLRVSHLINFHSEREVPCHFRKEDFSPVLKDSLGRLYPKSSKVVKLNLTKLPRQMVFDSEVKCRASDCDYISNNRFDLIYHLLEHKPEAVSTMSHCRLCNFMSDNLEEFYDHVASHTGEYRHRCDRCGQRGFSLTVLKFHHKDYHGAQTEQFTSDNMTLENECPYIYVCKICQYVQIHAKNIEEHNFRKHNGRAEIVKANMSRNIVIHTDELEGNVPRKLVAENKNLGAKLKRKSKVHLRKLKKRRNKSSVAKISPQIHIDSKHVGEELFAEKEINVSFQENKSIPIELEHHVAKQPQLIVKKVTNIPVFLGQEQEREVETAMHVDQIVDRILSNSYTSRSSLEIRKKISCLDDILRKVDNQSLEYTGHTEIEDVEKVEVLKNEDPPGRRSIFEKEVESKLSLNHLEAKKVNMPSLEKKIGHEFSSLDTNLECRDSDDTVPLRDDRPFVEKIDNRATSIYQSSPERHQLTNLISRLKTTLSEKLEAKFMADKDDTTSEQDNSDSDNQLVICEEDEIDSNCNSFSSVPYSSTTQEESTFLPSFHTTTSGVSFANENGDQNKICEGFKLRTSSALNVVKYSQEHNGAQDADMSIPNKDT